MIKIFIFLISINIFAQNKDRGLLGQTLITSGEIMATEAIRKSGYNNSKKLDVIYDLQDKKINDLIKANAPIEEIEAAKHQQYLNYRKIQRNIISGMRTFTFKVAGATLLYLDTGYRIYQLVMTDDDPGFIALIP